jgi:diadenosine tetraphosphate (Ap4A) HIT family hydrolase
MIVSQDCQICEEFATGTCPVLFPRTNRLLYDSAEFAVFPALGSFVDGYLLICPKAHVTSVASLGEAALGNLGRLLGRVKGIVRKHYTDPVVFEHGMANCHAKAGGCIDHAHLHVVPGRLDLRAILEECFSPQVLQDWQALAQWRGVPYLLAQPNDEAPVLICTVSDSLPSQFLRRQVAAALGVEEIWNWHDYLGILEIENTLRKLTPAFVEELEGNGLKES